MNQYGCSEGDPRRPVCTKLFHSVIGLSWIKLMVSCIRHCPWLMICFIHPSIHSFIILHHMAILHHTPPSSVSFLA